MSALKFIKHLFFPHNSNNQKAKILHSSSLTILTVFLVGFQLILTYLPGKLPQVLGYAANIKPSEVIRLTNEKRAQNGGLPPLTENATLSAAALAKGNDMLAKGYWAHFAPDGTSPWSFFTSFGYKYKYAGENLARDFSSDHLAVEAWMASPSHRENILNTNYKDIGIGVIDGKLSGVDTTIIVQFFGTPQTSAPSIPVAKAGIASATAAPVLDLAKAKQESEAALPITLSTPEPEPTATPSPEPTPTVTPEPTTEAVTGTTGDKTGLISPFESTKNVALIVVSVLLLALAIDIIIVRRKKIARIGGRTLAHIGFFGMILAVILILKAGRII